MGAKRSISRVSVCTTNAVSVASAAVAVVVTVMTSGNAAWLTLTSPEPEHMPVVTVIWVPMEAKAMHVLPFRLVHWNPLSPGLVKKASHP
jgi:hypothetical protein